MPNLCLTMAILAEILKMLQHGARASCALSELRVRELRFVRAASERAAARVARARRARIDSRRVSATSRARRASAPSASGGAAARDDCDGYFLEVRRGEKTRVVS